MYFLKETHAKTLAEVTNTKNADGLSGIDKMYMNFQKRDEGDAILADVNIETTIHRLKRMFDVPITDEEIQYYKDNHRPHPLQVKLIYTWFAKYFGSYRTENILGREDYIQLLLILKKKMLIEQGYDNATNTFISKSILPYIISGNLEDKVNNRLIRNTRFNAKIDENEQFEYISKHKYHLLDEIDPDRPKALLSNLINTNFTYCVYEAPELLGKPIEYNEDRVALESLTFMRQF